MASSFARFLVVNRMSAASYNAVSAASRMWRVLSAPQCCAVLSDGRAVAGADGLSRVYDGLLFTQRNSKVPSKANHGARPCSHVYRYIKVECKWYGPRWYRKRLKKVFRNSEDKIMP